jgi:plastocyanin
MKPAFPSPPSPRRTAATRPTLIGVIGALVGLVLAASPAAVAEECATTYEVTITHVFEPGDLYLKVGDCVHFTNRHGIEHSAMGLEREFNTGVLMPGGTSLFRFDEETVIPYICGVHPLMVGVFIIEEEE